MDAENDENITKLKVEIYSDFAPITPLIYSSLEAAYEVAPECWSLIVKRAKYDKLPVEIATKINRSLNPSLVRAITQVLLNIHHIKTKTLGVSKGEAQTNWDCDVLSNNGLAGRYADRDYKILKASRVPVYDEQTGETKIVLKIPPPGHSEKRKQYLQQTHRQQSIMDFSGLGGTKLPKHNTLYLWNPTASSLEVYLACPKWCGVSWVEEYFIQQIPHPVFTIPPLPKEEIVEDIILPKIDFGQVLDLHLPEADVLNQNEEEGGENQDESDENDLREQN